MGPAYARNLANVRRMASQYVIIKQLGQRAVLAKRKRNGRLSRYILASEVADALADLHDEHGYFSNELLYRKTIRKY